MSHIAYDHRALTVGGERRLIISGAIHYPRSTPAMWPALMKRSVEAGLNTIETYVFWHLHEPRRGVFDFTGRLDLTRFCQLAQEHGLNVILRIGPYICAEINYGGFPAWLRDVPGIQMRTWNQPFMQEMERWVRYVTNHLRPMFAPNGGPIIAAQIENEYSLIANTYGEAGARYKQWAADLGQSLNLGVPWIMCFGGAEGALETINGFYGHTQLERHWNDHPEQPAIWTENWPGWYDVWGQPHHRRPTRDVAYAVARFFAAGGTGVNHYMWHGGTNFGREAMYLQTTSYDYDAPLDEFGLPTTKSQALARLHAVLNKYASVLLTAERPTPFVMSERHVAFDYGPINFLCNDDPDQAADLLWEGKHYHLPAQSVTIFTEDGLRLNTAELEQTEEIVRVMTPTTARLEELVWAPEPMPSSRASGLTADRPAEQLCLTRDESDYCWYTARLAAEGEGVLTFAGVADLVHVFVDGQPVATTALPLAENRGALDGEAFTQSFALTLAPGEHELSLLCCAVGLIKGDWMIGMQNMADEKKGFWGQALWNGQPLAGPWTMRPMLVGERSGWYRGNGGADWSADVAAATDRPLRWWKATFDRPAGGEPLALDLGAMTKGLAWINGKCIGRYWLVAGTGETDVWLVPPVTDDRIGKPTQRYYHVPAEWLKPTDNLLVLFEEQGGDPTQIRLCRWIEA